MRCAGRPGRQRLLSLWQAVKHNMQETAVVPRGGSSCSCCCSPSNAELPAAPGACASACGAAAVLTSAVCDAACLDGLRACCRPATNARSAGAPRTAAGLAATPSAGLPAAFAHPLLIIGEQQPTGIPLLLALANAGAVIAAGASARCLLANSQRLFARPCISAGWPPNTIPRAAKTKRARVRSLNCEKPVLVNQGGTSLKRCVCARHHRLLIRSCGTTHTLSQLDAQGVDWVLLQ